ncbi:hypothetical protein DL96DRAFT_1815464 [Flagelloscypha sp. PMI_526]|nr:hypothetical protein DL96DRAFT_1815464 [Flagelloscypha sp. PMI_526]
MGVQGLQTYLREHRRKLAEQIELRQQPDIVARFVVDAWSFIYYIQLNGGLPWVYGGEYPRFGDLVASTIHAWLDVGVELHFVFDGPYPPLKFTTVIDRLTKSVVTPSQLFFRTSIVSRSQPRFLHENHILPPLSFDACVTVLDSLDSDRVHVYFADEEGDPFAVELAGRIGGYVVGADSDFVVLNHDGYRGSVPLDEMVWFSATQGRVPEDENNDGFQQVTKSKAKKGASSRSTSGSAIPPAEQEDLILSFSVYTPSRLAAEIQLPLSLLPLLGALLGNDYTKQTGRLVPQKLFFDHNSTPTQRIKRVSEIIQSILSSAQKQKSTKPLNSVIELIELTVNALLSHRPTAYATGEIDQLVDKIVESTLKYAIPVTETDFAPTEVCQLHPPDACKLLPLLSRKVTTEMARETLILGGDSLTDKEVLRARCLSAYRSGNLSPRLLDTLATSTFWPRLFLENPDVESTAVTFGRHLRQWSYAILDNALGLPEEQPPESPEASSQDVDSEDELVDVISDSEAEFEASSPSPTSPTSPISPMSEEETGRMPIDSLNGALQQINIPARHADTTELRRVSVLEHVRRGTRIAPESVSVPLLQEILPPLLSYLPEELKDTPLLLLEPDLRLTVFLRILESDKPIVRALPPQYLLLSLALRWVLQTLGQRATVSDSRERQKERWTRMELRCFLATFLDEDSNSSDEETESDAKPPPPELVNRHVHLVAQFSSAIEAVRLLAQTLQLNDRVPSPVLDFSGVRCHQYLTRAEPLPDDERLEKLFRATSNGLEESFGEELHRKKGKKQAGNGTSPKTGQKGKHNGGLFAFLGDANVEI